MSIFEVRVIEEEGKEVEGELEAGEAVIKREKK